MRQRGARLKRLKALHPMLRWMIMFFDAGGPEVDARTENLVDARCFYERRCRG